MHDAGWTARICQPPQTLCARVIDELRQGGFLDFRANSSSDRALRFLSPFAIERIERLDGSRCPSKNCAANVALGVLQEDLLKEGYYTQKVVVFSGGAAITLRTERIDTALKPLKGRCRFDLDIKCSDADVWLQEDQKSRELCGFAVTRQFIAATAPPEFVSPTRFLAASPAPTSIVGSQPLGSASFDTATTKVYEILYVHKICPSSITIVSNG